MSRTSTLVTLVFLTILSRSGIAQESAPAVGSKLLLSDAKKLVVDAVYGDEKKRESARKKLIDTRPEDRKFIMDAMKSMPFALPFGKKAPKDKTIKESWDLPDSGTKKGNFIVNLPKGYDGKKPFPLLFRFHGSGDTAEAFARNSQTPKTDQFICITPEIPSTDRLGWTQPGTFEFMNRLFVYARENFNVDPQRIYLSGHSAGGAAAFYYSQIWPHRVSAFYAMARLHWSYHVKPEPCMDTLRTVPGYFVIGLDDTAERVDGYKTAKKYYDEKKLPGEFVFVKSRGHEYMIEYHAKAYDFMMKSTRQTTPKEIAGIFYHYGDATDQIPYLGRRWWLLVSPRDNPEAPFKATISGQKISIDAPNIRRGRILLNDEMLNLDQPVIVELNGKVVVEKKIERSVEFLFEWFDAEKDRGDLYWNEVSFKEL